MEPWVKDIVEATYGSRLSVGLITKHPDGRTVKIISGQFWGTYGVSNHWRWHEIKSDGTIGQEETGYGWAPEDVKMTIDEATEELYEAITKPTHPKWLVSIGHDTQKDIMIYVVKKTNKIINYIDSYSKYYNGFNIKIKESGAVRPANERI
jgi:hypothetical protein